MIIVGASPALKKNVKDLKRIEGKYRDRFILVVVNSAAKYLLDNDIIPDIVISVDCDEEVWTRDLSKINREDITLLCSPFVWPEVPKNWMGKLYFIPMGCIDEEVQEKVIKQLGSIAPVPGCGNAFNEAVYLGWMVFNCRNYIFVGSELSWKKEAKYYVDGKHSNDEEDDNIPKLEHPDIYGEPVLTTAGHYVFKIWLEDLASRAPGTFINATEGGILGISVTDGALPWIKQFYLGAGIEYVKKIYSDCEDWRFMEAMKWNIAFNQGYDTRGIPNETMIKSLNPKTIIDVGCAGGSTVKELNERGYEAYGIDFSIVAATKWNGVSDRCMLAYADDMWMVENDTFDLAISDMLEHTPSSHLEEVIREISRVSKRQLFNIDFKNAEWLIDNRIEPHMVIQPPQWWRKELKRCGLKIVATSGDKTFITEKR